MHNFFHRVNCVDYNTYSPNKNLSYILSFGINDANFNLDISLLSLVKLDSEIVDFHPLDPSRAQSVLKNVACLKIHWLSLISFQ